MTANQLQPKKAKLVLTVSFNYVYLTEKNSQFAGDQESRSQLY